MYEIGIVDTRNVIKTIKEVFGYDFTDYAITTFRRRLDVVINNNKLRDADALLQKLQNEKPFFDQFLFDISVDTTEMFRDPSLWRYLKDRIIPEIAKGSTKTKIWVAGWDSGEELYSLAIILKEMGLLDQVQIYATSFSDAKLSRTKEGIIDPKQIEVNEANYERYNGSSAYANYYSLKNGIPVIDKALIENVTFIKQNTIFDNSPSGIRLILFRNQMIYYNQVMCDRVMKIMANSLVPGGYCIVGIRESLESLGLSAPFSLFDDMEKVYKKKNS
ncbi:CheR family methyltransferase [Williamwhitmania taraxaci]|uniref:Chemotaxis protein methyltransferase CheR n=1 Tax=Williamwhitmania taraxaci TaxID=1640674 RepID=A0A1G6PSD3_9BACT|nr:CheR family methyltransferase [Williamwhitmania taraxaci]SDC82554.1 chemotaxis protein methyltransferase CheR [Williamwhitmania taraxaci]